MGDVVRLDDYRPTAPVAGNGARDALSCALLTVPALRYICGVNDLADFLLISLWSAGFHVVPHGDPDDVA